MVTISNNQRDQAVRYLQALATLMEKDDRTKVVNLVRLARRLARRLKEKQSL